MNIIIKPRKEIDLPSIEDSIRLAFAEHEKIIFTFDIQEKLEKSYIILRQQWKKALLIMFFSYYQPKKPVVFIKNQTQNQGFNSNVLL